MYRRTASFLLVIVLILSCFALFPAAATGAKNSIVNERAVPEDAILYNNHAYKVFHMDKTWKEAELYCRQMYGHLMTITSSDEQDLLQHLSLRKKTNYWIGGTDSVHEGEWTWITGEKWTYTAWHSGEPSNSQLDTGEKEDYLQVCVDWNYQWNDSTDRQDSTASIGFICEWDHDGRSTPDVATDHVTDITNTSATVTFSVNDSGGKAVTDSGIEYGYSKKKTQSASYGALGEDVGTYYSLKITGLKENKKVFYRAYAENENGIAYGSWKSFKTDKSSAPKVKTLKPTEIEFTSACFGIDLTSTGYKKVTECGIYWGYSKSSLDNQVAFKKKNIKTGTFNKSISSLKNGATIYYQAYAINELGEGKGKVVSFQLRAARGYALMSAHLEKDEYMVSNCRKAIKTMADIFHQGGCETYESKQKVNASTLNSLLNELAKKTKDGDITYIYIVAHGERDESNPSGKGYMILDKTGIPYYYDTLLKKLKNVKGNIVLILNPCHSGSIGNSIDEGFVQEYLSRFAIIAAANINQTAFLDDDTTQFVHAFKQAYKRTGNNTTIKEFCTVLIQEHKKISPEDKVLYGGNEDMMIFIK